MRYLVLTDRATPYLLARVRWPDVAQAITVGSPDWLDDVGLFDLPYNPGAVRLTFTQAASVAAAWGRQLTAEPADGVPSFIRRLPANWSDLSPLPSGGPWASIPSVGNGPRPVASAVCTHCKRRALRPRPARRERREEPAAPPHSRAPPAHAGARRRTSSWLGRGTLSAGLVDLSAGGVGASCLRRPQSSRRGGIDGPFLLEAEAVPSRICLDVPGRIMWSRTIGASTHFGVTFRELGDSETDGVRHFIAAACSRSLAR